MKPSKTDIRIAVFNLEQATFAATHRWDRIRGEWFKWPNDDGTFKRQCKAHADLRALVGGSGHPGLAHAA